MRTGYSQTGVALVLVLWVIVLLTVIAGAMSVTQRNGVYMTSNIRTEREGRALVDAGIHFMMLQIKPGARNKEDNPWPIDGKLRPWQFAGHRIWVGMIPESGRMDLNRVDDRLLLALFKSAGLSEDQATAIRDAIVDWRDKDNTPMPAGAEDDSYKAAGRPVGARDEMFLSVEELQQVLGVTPELYKKVRPALTVDARQRKVNPFYAPPEVLRAIPGMDDGALSEFMAQRRQATRIEDVSMPVVEGNYFTKAVGIMYRVIAEVDMPDGHKVQASAIINSRRKTPHGYQVLRTDYSDVWHLGRIQAE